VSVLSIGDLENASGVPRTTIYAYLRLGLLPQPQKTATNRSLYTQEHVELLEEIAVLKKAGLSLEQIGAALEDKVDKANESAVDLVAQESERIHNRILAAAVEDFATKGYRNTRVFELTRRLGITTKVFYSHFPSKHRLLIECYTAMAQWSQEWAAAKQALTSDPGERLLWSLASNSLIHDLYPSIFSEVLVEGTNPEGELIGSVEAVWASIVRGIADAFHDLAPQSRSSSVPAELIDYSLFGAYERTLLRAAQDNIYSREDLLRTHLWLFLAVRAARAGKVDVDAELTRYEELISRLASQPSDDEASLADLLHFVQRRGSGLQSPNAEESRNRDEVDDHK
jgi:DNA-binding transcriptional MerR regulator